MKSTPKPSVFDWKAEPRSTLFTKKELAYMHQFATAKTLERKEMKIYSKAGKK